MFAQIDIADARLALLAEWDENGQHYPHLTCNMEVEIKVYVFSTPDAVMPDLDDMAAVRSWIADVRRSA